MKELDFKSDDFSDIVAKDRRYDARAYTLLTAVLKRLFKSASKGGQSQHITASDILEEFREFSLDQFGPMTYCVLIEWGVSSSEDLGEMMFNLVDSHRIERDKNDSKDDFIGGYDFIEAFLVPYAV